MASYDSTVIDAADAELTPEIGLERLQIPELPATELPTPVAWRIYAALTVGVVAFLLAVLLMATGVVATPHT
ncbi:MAG: hypothetical protein ACRDLZ_06945 [Gaiellaceae bacterium]